MVTQSLKPGSTGRGYMRTHAYTCVRMYVRTCYAKTTHVLRTCYAQTTHVRRRCVVCACTCVARAYSFASHARLCVRTVRTHSAYAYYVRARTCVARGYCENFTFAISTRKFWRAPTVLFFRIVVTLTF